MELVDIGDSVYKCEALKDRRVRNGRTEFLVKWKGWTARFNTWEPEDNILDPSLIRAFEYDQRSRTQRGTKRGRRGRRPKNPTPDHAERFGSRDSEDVIPEASNLPVDNHNYHEYHADSDDAASEVTDPDSARGKRPSVDIEEHRAKKMETSATTTAMKIVVKEEPVDPEFAAVAPVEPVSLPLEPTTSHKCEQTESLDSESTVDSPLSDHYSESAGKQYTEIVNNGEAVVFEELRNPSEFFEHLTDEEMRMEPRPRVA